MLNNLAIKELSNTQPSVSPSSNLKLAIFEVMVNILNDLPVTGVAVSFSTQEAYNGQGNTDFNLSLQKPHLKNTAKLDAPIACTISKRKTRHSEISLSLETCKPVSVSDDERLHYFLRKIELCILKEEELIGSAIKPATKMSLISTDKKTNITNTFSRDFDNHKEHPAIAKAINIISQRYSESFSMQELANECCISPSRLSALLKQRFDCSFKKILTSYRIEKAKEIFSNRPTRQITQVCIDVGFYDLSHFEKTFKRYVGVSPRVYRDKFRPKYSD